MHTSQERPKDSGSHLRGPDIVSVIIQTAHWEVTSVSKAVVLNLVTRAEPSQR